MIDNTFTIKEGRVEEISWGTYNGKRQCELLIGQKMPSAPAGQYQPKDNLFKIRIFYSKMLERIEQELMIGMMVDFKVNVSCQPFERNGNTFHNPYFELLDFKLMN